VNHAVVPTGINGRKSTIRAPSVFDALFNMAQFRNGRATRLADQAAGRAMNPVEIGSHDWNQMAEKLKADPSYGAAFTVPFGSNTIDQKTITGAIQEFEKTLVTAASRFDRNLRGNPTALNQGEVHGFQLFKDVGRASRRAGKSPGSQSFEIMWLYDNRIADQGGSVTTTDLGRYNVTYQFLDEFRFKAPQLRNVALGTKYFHDGSSKTLRNAVIAMVKYQPPAATSQITTSRISSHS
jgi:cytochrome c peroxidase